jgi:chromate reductase
MSDPRLLGLSGALRRNSTNRKLLREAARLFGPCDFFEADLTLPLYNGDDEAATGVPASVQSLSRQIGEADAVIISTPEYNKGLSGVLKNALDWVSRTDANPWHGKPVAVMSAAAGRSGGERGQAMLRQCLVPFSPKVLQGPELHLAGSAKAFDDEGQLVGDLYVKTLTDLMQALRAEMAH